jgi:hypothetical protein
MGPMMGVRAGHRFRGAVGLLAAAFLATVLALAPMRFSSADAATVSHDRHPAAQTQHLAALPVHKHSRLAIHKAGDRHAVDAVLADLPVLGAFGLVHEITRTGVSAPDETGTTAAARGPPAGELIS